MNNWQPLEFTYHILDKINKPLFILYTRKEQRGHFSSLLYEFALREFQMEMPI